MFLDFLQPPNCGSNRLRRQASSDSGEGTPATIEVYSGLYVNEANDLAKADVEDDSVYSEKVGNQPFFEQMLSLSTLRKIVVCFP